MAYKCEICGKGRTIGKSRAHKYGGKWAMRAQEKPRQWKPNLQNYTLNGKKVRLCTRCIKKIKFELKKNKLAQVVPEATKVATKPETDLTKEKETRKKTKKPAPKSSSKKSK